MPGDKSPEVLIAGAGPVGLFAALCLSRRGVAVRIVDTGVWACSHSYALALHPQTLPLFQELGLLDQVLAHCYPVHSVALCGASGPRARVSLSGAGAAECLAVVRQDVLEGLLEQALSRYGVHVEWRHEVAGLEPGPDCIRARIDRYEKESRGYVIAHTEWVVAGSSTLDVQYVAGADGYSSRVRRALNYDFAEVGPAQYYAVFEFPTDADLQHEMSIVFGQGTADVVWPLPNGDCRWSFLLPGHSDPGVEGIKDVLERSGFGHFPTERTKDRVFRSEGGHDPLLTEENLRRLIAERAPWFHWKIGSLKWSSVVRFERRLTSGFGQGRLWLAGDAAHLTGPVGVQSMNAGLAEAYDLAQALASIVRDGASPGILDTYGQRWLAQWQQLHGQKGSLQPGPAADPWVASHAAELLSCLPATGEALGTLTAQLGLALSGR